MSLEVMLVVVLRDFGGQETRATTMPYANDAAATGPSVSA